MVGQLVVGKIRIAKRKLVIFRWYRRFSIGGYEDVEFRLCGLEQGAIAELHPAHFVCCRDGMGS
jgi:hypothetical protein